MSSLIGHAAVGAAVFLGHAHIRRNAIPALALLVFMAVLPDFDYFAFWVFSIDFQPRFTHSLAFAFASAGSAWALLKYCVDPENRVPFAALLLASCSHALLDLLVGVHPVCVFWPLPLPELQSPVGLLPSAGRLSLVNFYFWRNLLIECGVLFPLLACYIGFKRKVAPRRLLQGAMALLPIWIAALAWSIHVHG